MSQVDVENTVNDVEGPGAAISSVPVSSAIPSAGPTNSSNHVTSPSSAPVASVGPGDTRTFTRTEIRVNDQGGEVRTVTRLSTQLPPLALATASSAVVSAPAEALSLSSTSLATGSDNIGFTDTSSGTNSSRPSSSASLIATSIGLTQTNVVATTLATTTNDDLVRTFTPTPTDIGNGGTALPSVAALNTLPPNRMAVDSSGSAQEGNNNDNIFVPGHKFFPLGITAVVIGGLFVLISVAIILVRVCGWNRKRKLRTSIPSFIGVDPYTPDPEMYDRSFTTRDISPYNDNFETITTNIASTDPLRPVSITPTPARMYSRTYGYPLIEDLRSADRYPAIGNGIQSNDRMRPVLQARALNDRPINPFLNPPRSNVPSDVPMSVNLGSPVPSFNTDRYLSEAAGDNGSRGNKRIGRSLTDSSGSSNSSITSFGPEEQLRGYVPTLRYARRSNGSIDSIGSIGQASVYSASSSQLEQVLWDGRVVFAETATSSERDGRTETMRKGVQRDVMGELKR